MTPKKVDRRVQRTRQLLQKALITLILEKGYDKITVQNILDEANVGRSTFYAHYLDKDDLMAGSLALLRDELHLQMVGAKSQAAAGLPFDSLALFRHTQEQHQLYKAMIGGRGVEVVVAVLNEVLTSLAKAHFAQIVAEGGTLSVPMAVLTTYLAGTLQTLLTWWLDHGLPHSAEQMNDYFVKLVMGGVTAVLVENGEPGKTMS